MESENTAVSPTSSSCASLSDVHPPSSYSPCPTNGQHLTPTPTAQHHTPTSAQHHTLTPISTQHTLTPTSAQYHTPMPTVAHTGASSDNVEEQESGVRVCPRSISSTSKSDDAVTAGRKRRKPVTSSCPVCGLTLRTGEMEAHFTQELDKMVRLPQSRPLAQRTPTAPACTSPTPSTSTEGYSNTPTAKPRPANSAPRHGEGWKTYQRVRNNRQLRVRVKRPRTLVDLDGEEGMTCPVCDLRVPLDGPGDINTHIDKCLRAAERECEEAAEVDVEGEYEEYEWCGQTRVRATQMLRAEGQLHALGTRVVQGREDEVVEVCEDDSLSVYGPAQYTDTDLQPHNHLAHTNTDHDVDVGDLVDTTTTLHTPQAPTDHIPSSSNSLAPEEPASGSSSSNSRCSVNSAHSLRAEGESANNPAVVEALRARLQELEEETPRARYSCRVCHGEYVRPLVSVSCWHVHCQQCWLPALAAKKLCPQCSVITAPGDLRRVYL